MIIPRPVAIKTENLKPTILWESVPAQPRVKGGTFAGLLSVDRSIILHMIDGNHFGRRLTTTRAPASVCSNDFGSKLCIPSLDVGFLTRLAAGILGPVAIRAQQLKPFLWKSLLAQPPVKPVPSANKAAVSSSTIVNVVHGKKLMVRLATRCAHTTICRNDLVVKSLAPLLLIRVAMIANEKTRPGLPHMALTAQASLPFLGRKLTVALILARASLLLRVCLQRFPRVTMPLYHRFRSVWISLVLIMATSLARKAKSLASAMPIRFSFWKIAATSGAMFQWWVSKVKDTLGESWYTIHAIKPPSSVLSSRFSSARNTAKAQQFMPLFYHKAPITSNTSIYLPCDHLPHVGDMITSSRSIIDGSNPKYF